MTKYTADADNQPKGGHNRRLALGMDPDDFAAEAGITTEQLRDYERTSPDHDFDREVARRVTATLDRLERTHPNMGEGFSDHPDRNSPILVHPNGDAELDHSNHERLDASELENSGLAGAIIYDGNNVELGRVSHLHGSGSMAEVVVSLTLPGQAARQVALGISQLDFMRDDTGRVHALCRLTMEELSMLPSHHHHH